MRTPPVLVIGLIFALPCGAQPAAVAPWMTGAWLLDQFDGGDVSDIQDGYGRFTRADRIELRRQMAKQHAEGYVDGVHDATGGRLWCFGPSRPSPSTLREDARWGLRSLPPDRLKRNASDLIVELWRKKWPCGGKS